MSKSDFGSLVKTINDLKKGNEYILHEPGMNEWIGSLKLASIKGDSYSFESTLQFDDFSMDLTKDELAAEIQSKLVYNQK